MGLFDPAFNTDRRQLLKLAAATALATPTLARAAWPDRPIRLVVPSAAGGAADVICRIVANELAKLVGTANHGRSLETLSMIEAAAKNQSVCMDCYPYNASSTMLLPARVLQSSDVLVTWSKAEPQAAGRSLFELAKERNQSPEDVAKALQCAGAIYFAMDEGDVSRILSHPVASAGDGRL